MSWVQSKVSDFTMVTDKELVENIQKQEFKHPLYIFRDYLNGTQPYYISGIVIRNQIEKVAKKFFNTVYKGVNAVIVCKEPKVAMNYDLVMIKAVGPLKPTLVREFSENFESIEEEHKKGSDKPLRVNKTIIAGMVSPSAEDYLKHLRIDFITLNKNHWEFTFTGNRRKKESAV